MFIGKVSYRGGLMGDFCKWPLLPPTPLPIMKKSQLGDLSGMGLLRKVHPPQEVLEAGVGAEGVHSNPDI